jgi:hypothetical protein
MRLGVGGGSGDEAEEGEWSMTGAELFQEFSRRIRHLGDLVEAGFLTPHQAECLAYEQCEALDLGALPDNFDPLSEAYQGTA